MPVWNTGTRLEELELMLITNKSEIFRNQNDHIKVMQLVAARTALELEKREKLLKMDRVSHEPIILKMI